MNIHPIIVHFPIALLSLYAIFEMIRFKKVVNQPYWFHIKAIFVLLGTLGAFTAALSAPKIAGNQIVTMHRAFAQLSISLFIIIAPAYLLAWRNPQNKYSRFIFKPFIIIPLAILALVVVTITGGLGGAIVYGTQSDPFMIPVFKLLRVY